MLQVLACGQRGAFAPSWNPLSIRVPPATHHPLPSTGGILPRFKDVIPASTVSQLLREDTEIKKALHSLSKVVLRQGSQVRAFLKWNSWRGPAAAAAAAKLLQSCPTLCDPMDCSLPGFSVHGILQARTLEWVAISFSNAWKWKVKGKSLSHVRLFTAPWTAAHQAPPSTGVSRQEYWSGVPWPSPEEALPAIYSP